jgi:hypothetical protein
MLMCLRVVPAGLLVAASLGAQAASVIDEGTFTITRAGAPYGTESFKIFRRPGRDGMEYVAQCTRTMEGRVVRTALMADSNGHPTSYSRGGPGLPQLSARRAMNRLTVNEEAPQASTRDYAFTPGTLILDDDVIHQHYFVTWRDPRSLGFVVPVGRLSGQGALTEVGREDLTIGRVTVAAVHYSFGEGDDRREIWIDSSRRLLRVTHPARQIVGTRDLPPR